MLESWRRERWARNTRYLWDQALPLARYLSALGRYRLAHGHPPPAEEICDLVEKHILETPLTREEKSYLGAAAGHHRSPQWALPLSFFRLPSRLEAKVFSVRSSWAHHLARVEMIRHLLPPAKRILDLGGAADESPEGQLLLMGYPHVPDAITIVDLPPDERVHTAPKVRPETYVTEGGTRVSYVYGSMQDFSKFSDASFDLVWSGQSIEHITRAEVATLARDVLRVLQPGGCFCLDTPNRKVTRLISEESYIHPEHKYEYEPDELARDLEQQGFEIERKEAVSPLPISLRLGRLCKLELMQERRVGPPSESGFSFFLKARKPR